jgi:hypothetical protein
MRAAGVARSGAFDLDTARQAAEATRHSLGTVAGPADAPPQVPNASSETVGAATADRGHGGNKAQDTSASVAAARNEVLPDDHGGALAGASDHWNEMCHLGSPGGIPLGNFDRGVFGEAK